MAWNDFFSLLTMRNVIKHLNSAWLFTTSSDGWYCFIWTPDSLCSLPLSGLPWLLFSRVFAFFPSKVLLFLSALSHKGGKCMEQDQKHSKTCTEAGMKSVQECWHGKERNYPSMKVKKVEQERERASEKTMRHTHVSAHTHTHISTRAKPPHSSAALHRGTSVSPAHTRHIKEPSQQVSIATPFSGIDATQ